MNLGQHHFLLLVGIAYKQFDNLDYIRVTI